MAADRLTTRRDVLHLAVAAPVAAAIPFTALAMTEPPVDPIFALIERRDRERDNFVAEFDEGDKEKEARLWAAYAEAEEELDRTKPVTLEGLHAKLAYMRRLADEDAIQFATASFTLTLLDNLLPDFLSGS